MTDQFTPEQVGAVAKGLTKAQAAVVACLERRWHQAPRKMARGAGQICFGLAMKGLVQSRWDRMRLPSVREYRLTPLGLAVRQYLQAPGTQPDSGAGPSPATRGSAPAVASKSTRNEEQSDG